MQFQEKYATPFAVVIELCFEKPVLSGSDPTGEIEGTEDEYWVL